MILPCDRIRKGRGHPGRAVRVFPVAAFAHGVQPPGRPKIAIIATHMYETSMPVAAKRLVCINSVNLAASL